jgi:putative oxidoreductase
MPSSVLWTHAAKRSTRTDPKTLERAFQRGRERQMKTGLRSSGPRAVAPAAAWLGVEEGEFARPTRQARGVRSNAWSAGDTWIRMAPDEVQSERARRASGVTALKAARVAAGAVFVIFGLGKFLNHGDELSSFETYGIPWPEVMVYVVGVLEVVGGLALLVGVGVAPVALLMAGNMVVAIVVSGIAEGEIVPSLTLAPVLLAVMGLLLWTETRSLRPRMG